jgi:tetratricopeptide (TPR) repeat protein
VYVADNGAGCVYQLGPDASLTEMRTNSPIRAPCGIATDLVTGNLLVMDRKGRRLVRLAPVTGAVDELVTGVSLKFSVANVDVTPDGKHVFLTDTTMGVILTLTRIAKETAYQRGHAHAEKGELDQAIADFTEAIERDPKHALAYGDRGFVYAATGDQEKAQADWAEATRLDPGCPKQYYYRGRFFAGKGRLDLAIGQYDKALQLDGSLARAHAWRGNARAETADVEGAIADYDAAIQLDSNDPLAYSGRARVRAEQGDRDGAMADYAEAIRLRPNDPDLYRLRGEGYVKLNQLDEAVADFDQAIRIDPANSRGYSDRAAAHLKMENYYKAIADCQEALRLDPQSRQAINLQNQAYNAMGEKAIPLLTEQIEAEPDDARLRLRRAELYIGLKQWERAIADYAEAIRISPNAHYLYGERGKAYAELGQFDKAFEDHSRLIELTPKDPGAWRARAELHVQMKQWEQAIADSNRAIELYPRDARLYDLRAVARLNIGEYSNAVDDWEEVLRLHFPPGLVAVGWQSETYLALEDLENAIRSCTERIESRPGDPTLLLLRGHCYARLSRWKEAGDDFAKAMELDPDNCTYGILLAKVRLQNGEVEAYRQVCRELLARFGDADWIIAGRAMGPCKLLPDAVSNWESIAQQTERHLEQAVRSGSLVMSRHGHKGIADYRAGHFASAIESLSKSRELNTEKKVPAEAQNCLFLAMAHHRLGEEQQSRRLLAEARQIMEAERPNSESGDLGSHWSPWVTLDIIRREAEELIEGKDEG